jgi:hypothetical protein
LDILKALDKLAAQCAAQSLTLASLEARVLLVDYI